MTVGNDGRWDRERPAKRLRDRRSLPLQVRDHIVELIATDRLRPGDQLPTEPDISAHFDVGRTTVREALKLLEQDGVITVRHGIGRFVAAPHLQETITSISGITELMRRRGLQAETRVLSVEECGPDERPRLALGLKVGDPVLRLERARAHAGTAFVHSVDIVPRELLPPDLSEIDWSGSLFELLEAAGHRYASAITEIGAAWLDPQVAERLGVDHDLPWMSLIQTVYTDRGAPLLFSQDAYRGDQFTFTVVRRRTSP